MKKKSKKKNSIFLPYLSNIRTLSSHIRTSQNNRKRGLFFPIIHFLLILPMEVEVVGDIRIGRKLFDDGVSSLLGVKREGGEGSRVRR